MPLNLAFPAVNQGFWDANYNRRYFPLFTFLPCLPQVDQLMRQVADEAGLDIESKLADAPQVGDTVSAEATAASASAADPLSRRLAALRD